MASPIPSDGDTSRTRRARQADGEPTALTMRELGKLTADQVVHLRHPVAVTNNGVPVAWLVPLTPSERRRAELVAEGRIKPGHPRGLTGLTPLPAVDSGPTLSELLTRMREQEHA